MLRINKKKGKSSHNATFGVSLRAGFSFVEIVVIIAILVVLLAVFAPMLISNVETSRIQKDDSTMDELVNAVRLAITDSETFDETYDYSIPNNYMTYSDSSGVYGQQIADEEYWAPDGSGEGVTITFNPDENGNYDLSKGIVNDMTYGNGSVAEKRTAEGVKQCYFEEMGNQLLYAAVKQSVGSRLVNTSATYTNSSYTVFIRFTITDGTRKALVNGAFNGTNLSEDCQAAVGSNTSSYDEESKPIVTTPSGGKQNANYTDSDLTGGGSIGNSLPSYKPDNKCVYVSSKTGSTIEWKNTSNGGTYYFTQNGDKWTSNNQNKSSTTATSTWTIDVEESTKYNLKYFVSSESVSYDYLQLTLNGTQIDKVGGTSYSTELSKDINLVEGTNTLIAKYRKDGSVNKGQDLGYVKLSAISTEKEIHRCTKHGNEEHEPDYVLVQNTATCEESGKITYNCTKCDVVQESTSKALGHDWTFIRLPSGDIEGRCNRCGKLETHSCTGNPCAVCGAIPFTVTAENRAKVGFAGEENENLLIPERFVDADGQRYRVVAIDSYAFYYTNLTSVNIPDGVTSIGSYAFYYCEKLTSVNIPDGVTSIYCSAFHGCNSLTSINIPDGVTSIGEWVFAECSSLTSINIPDSVTSIDYAAFIECSSLTSITIPDGVTSIGREAFRDCSSLTDVYYTGTEEQWNDITKGSNWKEYVPSTCIVHCTDGDIPIADA